MPDSPTTLAATLVPVQEVLRDEVPGDADETGGDVRWRRLAVPLRHFGRVLGVAAFEVTYIEAV